MIRPAQLAHPAPQYQDREVFTAHLYCTNILLLLAIQKEKVHVAIEQRLLQKQIASLGVEILGYRGSNRGWASKHLGMDRTGGCIC